MNNKKKKQVEIYVTTSVVTWYKCSFNNDRGHLLPRPILGNLEELMDPLFHAGRYHNTILAKEGFG